VVLSIRNKLALPVLNTYEISYFNLFISLQSMATHLSCGAILTDVLSKNLLLSCNNEIILKIGSYLPELCLRL